MGKLTPAQKLAIYKRTLRQYLATNDPKTATHKALIAKLEVEARNG